MEGLTYPSLLGVRIRKAAPLQDVWLELDRGLVALYGRNGAGKTRLLRALSAAASTGPSKAGDVELVFKWLPPPWTEDAYFELVADDHERAEFHRWQMLPGNPWGVLSNRPDLDWAAIIQESTAGGGQFDFDRHRRAFDAATPPDLPLSVYHMAREVFFGGANPWEIDGDDEAELAARASIEVALQGWFSYGTRLRRSSNLLSGPDPIAGRALNVLGRADASSTPNLGELVRIMIGEHDPGDNSNDMFETMLHGRWGLLTTDMSSIVGVADGEATGPWWYGDEFMSKPWRFGAPTRLIDESDEIDLDEATITAVTTLLAAGEPGRDDDSAGAIVLDGTRPGEFRLHPQLAAVLAEIAQEASRWASMLLEAAPRLELDLRPPSSWVTGPALAWYAVDGDTRVGLGELSRAQQRWTTFAVRLALQRSSNLPLLVLVDEPEAALHRRAERHLVDGLSRVSDELGATVVVATHSPAFLARPGTSLRHVHRDPRGATRVEPVDPRFGDRATELGLDPADLLQLCRCLLLVEGQHELVILDEVIGDELRGLGVEMLCMRGATRLKTWDAQLVQRYTDVPFVVLVDNDQADRLADIWHRAITAADNGGDYFTIIEELKDNARGSEGEFLRELCKNLITSDDRNRFRITAFSRGDVPEYLPPSAIASVPPQTTWDELRAAAGDQALSSSKFKKWMQAHRGASYGDERLRAAASTLDSIPDDFVQLLDLLRYTVGRHWIEQ